MLDMNLVIANNILMRLKEQNKKQVDLADGIGISKQTVSKMLNGSRAINAIELRKIAEYLGVTMDTLAKLPEAPQENNIIHAFMGRVASDGGKNALAIADTLSDMILFHTRVRTNGMQMMQPWEGSVMRTVLDASLFENNPKRFRQICDLSRKFMGVYCVNSIIGENIFQVLSNYARRNDVTLEILRYPFQDDELWAFTFLKKGTIFVCINSELPQNKQVFAAAHELYHIHCYVEDVDQNIIRSGSLLDSKTVDEAANTQEDIEANAFAALLLMPDHLLNEQMMLYGLPKSNVAVDDILALMDFFGTPYKAAVLRLYESNNISKATATELLSVPAEDIQQRISLTGKAKRWMLDGRGIETFGSLEDNLDFNRKNELLTEPREAKDTSYLANLKKQLGIL